MVWCEQLTNPFDPPIINRKISAGESVLSCSHVEVGLRDPGMEEAGGFFMLLQENKSVCMHRKQRLHSREKDEGRGRGLICGSVGEKEGRGNKKKGGLGVEYGRDTIHRWTAGKRESQPGGRQIDSSHESHSKQTSFFSFSLPVCIVHLCCSLISSHQQSSVSLSPSHSLPFSLCLHTQASSWFWGHWERSWDFSVQFSSHSNWDLKHKAKNLSEGRGQKKPTKCRIEQKNAIRHKRKLIHIKNILANNAQRKPHKPHSV